METNGKKLIDCGCGIVGTTLDRSPPPIKEEFKKPSPDAPKVKGQPYVLPNGKWATYPDGRKMLWQSHEKGFPYIRPDGKYATGPDGSMLVWVDEETEQRLILEMFRSYFPKGIPKELISRSVL